MGQIASDVEQSHIGLDTESLEGVGKAPRQLFWMRFKQDRAALLGLAFIIFLILMALFAPLITGALTGHSPTIAGDLDGLDSFGFPKSPSSELWFGADSAGRDLFVRVIYGARTSLAVALIATTISVVIGVTLGLVAGYFGGVVDTIVSRVIDIVLSLPLVLFAVGIAGACSATAEGCLGGLIKPNLTLVIAVVALFSWPYIGRIVRGNTLSIRQKEFIEASRSLGAGNGRIMFREVLPNLVAPIIVYATLIIPNNIVFEASLSFLGVGVPERVPSWGDQLSVAARFLDDGAWWMMVFPGFFLVSTTLAFNLVGDGLRDALDPRTAR